MESIAYYDGKIGAPEELMVPFNDRVHFFGDGCYDATVGANGKVYLLQDHLDLLFTSAKALDINIPMRQGRAGQAADRPAGQGGQQGQLCILAGHPRCGAPQPCV